MSQTSDQMELREAEITAHYTMALSMLQGFDHAPRIGKGKEVPRQERSSGVGTRRRFRSTTPGLVTRRTVPTGAVQLMATIEGADDDDALMSPVQATVLNALRRAISIALAVAENYASVSGLGDLKRANLEGALPAARKTEFAELLAAEALITLYVFGNATAYLLSAHQTEVTAEVGEVEEILTDNGQTALHGCLWELDQDIATHAPDDTHLVATVTAFAEALMEKVSLRAQNAPRLAPFIGASWHVEADDFTVQGFTPATKAKSQTLTMTFKKPHEVVGNHIAKYQGMEHGKMPMTCDFDRRLNPFAVLGCFILACMSGGKPGTGKTTLIQIKAGMITDDCSVALHAVRCQILSSEKIYS
ncbi:MAG: AAA family ATPase, partial [Tateyamaria sp.]